MVAVMVAVAIAAGTGIGAGRAGAATVDPGQEHDCSTELTRYGGWGHARIGLARSNDLVHREVPPGPGRPEGRGGVKIRLLHVARRLERNLMAKSSDDIPEIEEPDPLDPEDAADIAPLDSEIDFDDEQDEDQVPLDETEAAEAGVLLDDPEALSDEDE